METWGISGPDWLKLYGALLVVPFVLGLAWRFAQVVRSAGEAPRDLTVHHLAYLAGGRRRVAESAVAQLLAAKRMRVSSKGLISVIPGPAVRDRTERAVLGLSSRGRLYTLVGKLGPIATRMNDELATAGLAVPEKAVRLRKKVVVGLSIALLILGLIRMSSGVSNHRPVGWLMLEIVAAAGLTMVAVRLRRRDDAVATVAGKRLLREAKSAQRGRTSVSGPSLSRAGLGGAGLVMAGAGAAGAVALGGMALYPDPAVHTALAYTPTSYGGGSDGGGSSCSGGSSCGGGGCGGGCGG